VFSLNDIIINDITGAFTVYSPKGRRETIHKRRTFGLSFCIEGQITYTHNGKSFVSNKDCAVILPKGQTYSLHGDKKGVFTVVNFECDSFACSTVRAIPISSNEPFIKEFEQIKALSLLEGNRTKIISILYNTIHRLTTQSTVASPLASALKYIEENYSDSYMTNEKVASNCGISEVYLRKLFVKQIGVTPKQFVLDLRIQRAKQMLREGILKINAVAEKCGFANQYHFCRAFKEKTGITPSLYMKENMINKI
jgi:AraC-like DNA-binding protein